MVELRATNKFPARFGSILLLAATIVMASASCGGGGGAGGSNNSNVPTDPLSGGSNTGGSTSHSLSVTVSNNQFAPAATTITKGSTVTWTWNTCVAGYSGNECTSHTVTFDDGPTSQLQSEGTYSRTFDTVGTFKYHCTVHGTAMSGTVTVE